MNLMWFRRDLRIEDNPALFKACQDKKGVIAVHITTPKTWASHHMGKPQQNWLTENLKALEKELAALNIPLLQLKTDYFSECPVRLLELAKKHHIEELYFNLEYEWDERRRDERVIKTFSEQGLTVKHFHDQCLHSPETIKTQQNTPYSVFTPYKKASLSLMDKEPDLVFTHPYPSVQPKIALKPSKKNEPEKSSSLEAGHQAAIKKLQRFITQQIENYHQARDIPSLAGTSKLSAYLALGVLSVRECINALLEFYKVQTLTELQAKEGPSTWVSELIWRDFYKMVCFQYPHVCRGQPFKEKTRQLTWHHNEVHLNAWQKGQTGVPIIDAAMRQLNQTGWMHNRLRMITAMYLSKNLWLDWRLGEAYFAEKLIDWDFAANNGGWQWSASTGTDAAPYFRVFNPISQSERFDKEGEFIKHYCPELNAFDKKNIHDPHIRGVNIKNYPKPLVNLKQTRAYAIEQFKALKA